MKNGKTSQLLIPSFLLAFIFCGAVVGETVSIALVVSAYGSAILSKLYLVNGVILLSLPLFFFKYIDKVNRGKLLSTLLFYTTLVLGLVLVAIICTRQIPVLSNSTLIVLYPIAYLSKTILFLTFWTMANDIYSTPEAKKAFPVIAAWGFGGALFGVILAKVVLSVVDAQALVLFWIVIYGAAWTFTKRMQDHFGLKLQPREDLPDTYKRTNVFNIGNLLTIKLIRMMGVFYYVVFVAVFSLDYLFWRQCHEWFTTSKGLASFQFSFYFVHASITIIALRTLLPIAISKIGFTKILYGLPIVLSAGGGALYLVLQGKGIGLQLYIFSTVQMFRYILFEISFAPSYQMLFTALPKEKRGRAKTLLEGVVKPGAIFTTGILLLVFGEHVTGILLVVALSGVALCLIVYVLRKIYTDELIHESEPPLRLGEIIVSAGREKTKKLDYIINQYAFENDTDMKVVAIKLLRRLGTPASFSTMENIYNQEKVPRVREAIAQSVDVYFNYNTKTFVEKLLSDKNHRIRANVLFALNKMNCNWKKHLKPQVLQLLFEKSMRVQIEAACFLWQNGRAREKITVFALLNNLLSSEEENRRVAGLYLSGRIRAPGWEQVLLENLKTTSKKIFIKSLEVIFSNATLSVRVQTLTCIDLFDRSYIELTGKVLEGCGEQVWDAIVTFIPGATNKRMIFEMVRCLRIIADQWKEKGSRYILTERSSDKIHSWIEDQLGSMYRDAVYYVNLKKVYKKSSSLQILEDALRENQLRICEWAVNAIVLLDKKDVMVWRHGDLDIRELDQRYDLVEIFETNSSEKLVSFVLPLLKQESWDVLARVGKNNFRLRLGDTHQGILYFMQSENRWVALCALYLLEEHPSLPVYQVEVKRVLEQLKQDNDCHVAQAAKHLIAKNMGKITDSSRAFELLESVLFFKQTSLFRRVGADKLLRLVEIAQLIEYQKDDVISAQGEISDQLYVVKKGSLRIEKTIEERKAIVAVLESGETYGEIGLFSQSSRSATAVAQEKTEVFVLKRAAFKRIILENPDISFNLLEVLSERLRKNGEEIVALKSTKKVFDRSF